MKNYLVKLSYDGSNFCGWQIQKKGRTVQQVLESALTKIAKTEIKTTASGRTDAGVHALSQYVNFKFPITMTTRQIQLAIQSKLPADVFILEVRSVPDHFHARYDASSRTYQYILTTKYSPFTRSYKSYLPNLEIDPKIVRNCLKYFIGKHDLTSFSKFNPDIKSNICDVELFTLKKVVEDYIFAINANRFLHHMVRRIVGTILNIARTGSNPQIIQELMLAKTPNNKLITTAPPNGLYLIKVEYPSNKLKESAR
ncbi:MAG: tRNA pseudouridine(38-40) synthase TruA [Candidatus Cloacimonetes bacterium]|nr:tRNA pseudouridine(38-40) synthase TruA [Candidatus Cloacimonadota bacterium]